MRRVSRISRDWLFLFAYLAVIFIVLPYSAYIVQRLVKAISFFSYIVSFLVYGIIAAAVIALVIYVLLAKKSFKSLRLLALGVILFIGLYGLKSLESPSDKLHIVEYAALSFLLFRVMRFYDPSTMLYWWCINLVVVAGLADESIQIFIPGRTFSLRDLMTDVYTGLLSQLTIALVICPRLEKWRLRMSFLKENLLERRRWITEHKIKRDIGSS